MYTVKKVQPSKRLNRVTFYKYDVTDPTGMLLNLEVMGPHEWECEADITVGTQLDINDAERTVTKNQYGRTFNNLKAKAQFVTVLDGVQASEPVIPSEVQRPLWEKKVWEYADGEPIHCAPGESMDEACLRLGLIKALPKKASETPKGNSLPF